MVFNSGSSKSLQTLNGFFKSVPTYAKYGPGRHQHARNMVTLLTNSIRVELRDILKVLKSVAAKPHVLTRDLVAEVYCWLKDAFHFMNISLDVLQYEIMEKTGEKVSDMGSFACKKRVFAFGQVQRSFMKILETQDKFSNNLPPGESFSKLCYAAAELRNCIDLLSVVDRVLPGLIREAFSSSEIKRFEKRMFQFLEEKSGSVEVVEGTMTRWMTESQTSYMKNKRGLLLSRGRVSKARARNLLEHGRLPCEIGMKLREEEKMQGESQDVMDPELQRRLNRIASIRLSKKFSSFAATEDWSSDEEC